VTGDPYQLRHFVAVIFLKRALTMRGTISKESMVASNVL
jgi:hypothetical protein